MKKLVAVLLLVIAGLSATVFVQSRTNADLNAQITALNQEIRPLRTSEELMLSLSDQVKEWENAARPVFVDVCTARGSAVSSCTNSLLYPDMFRSALRVWPEVRRR